MGSKITLTGIHIYPVKSLGGISVPKAVVEPRGLQYDRRFMLIDDDGRFMSQRECPKMATVRCTLSDGGLMVSAPNMPPLEVVFDKALGPVVSVSIWKSTCDALLSPPETNQWFQTYLGRSCRLVFMPDTTERAVEPKYDPANSIVSFADGYPCLLTNTASLDDLNKRMTDSIPMNRFRPNMVVSGSVPFEEDHWKKIAIGHTRHLVAKPCDRCVVTTIDQTTGVGGKQPLAALSQFRKFGNKVMMGMNLLPLALGTIRVGDTVHLR